MKNILAVGLDPGLSGAIAMLHNGKAIDAWAMPVEDKQKKGKQVEPQTLVSIANTVADYASSKLKLEFDSVVIAVEQVSAMPKQGISSAFNFGDSYGCARSFSGVVAFMLAPMAVHIINVTPATWKKAAGLSNRKAWSLTLARRTFSNMRPRLARKKDEGVAEALLLALYAHKTHLAS